MSLKIGLYHNMNRCGGVALDSVFVMGPADYTCNPRGIVSHDQVTQIAKVLRRQPIDHAGVVGNYNWREE